MSWPLQVLLPAILAAPLSGPASSEVVDSALVVERAVAVYARSIYQGRRLGFDNTPWEFMTPHAHGERDLARYRSPEHVEAIAHLMGGAVVRFPDLPLCKRAVDSACVQTVIRIGVPAMAGDAARVWLYAHELLDGGELSEETDRLLLPSRDGDSWRVVQELEIRRTYSG